MNGQTFRQTTHTFANLVLLTLLQSLVLLVTPPTNDDDLRLFTIPRQSFETLQTWNVLSATLHNTSTS